ncbi:uncharacterized protein LOC136087477 isoform X2 [Hydra vulgaris]|uniref:Uncharacterized protein LOC136087477 isoform X2 n=1 Tax=Hydra vulgaris TaxID=6087 RepID=A0ABM4CWR5_HYDVU
MACESKKVPEVNRPSNLLSDDENSLEFNQIGKNCANFVAGQNFTNTQEANRFCQKTEEKLRVQEQRNTDNTQSVATTSVAPRISLSPSSNDLKKKEKPGKKKEKLSKEDISTPSDFRHVGHVVWDPRGGFEINNIDPQWRKLFDTIGVTEKQLEDEETSKFIYEFVESHGGIEKATKELEKSGNADDNTQSVATTSVAPRISLSPSSNDLKKKEKPGKKKEKLSKEDISTPSDFRHVGYVWRKLFETIGVTEEQLKDEETSKFIYEFVESHWGIGNATKELKSGNADGALPPPTRSASLQLSSQGRPQHGRASTIPQSIKRETTVKPLLALAEQAGPMHPQQVPRGPSSPPQMSDPPLLSPLNTPAPSPQPRVSGAGTLPPIPFQRKSLTAQPAKQYLFHQVHQERQLNKVEPQQKKAGDGKDDLLNAICLGAQREASFQLNHTSVADNDQGEKGAEDLVIDSYHFRKSSELSPPTRSASLSLSSQGRPQLGCASTIPLSIKREATVKTLLALAEQADLLSSQQVLRGPSSPPQMSAPPLISPLNTPAPSPQPIVSGVGTLPPIPFPRKSLTARPAKQDLFDQVHQERQLNKVEPQQKETGDEKDDLLNTICLGAQHKAGLQLNHTSVADNDQGVENAEELVIDSYHIQDSGALPPPTRSASLSLSSQGRPQLGCASTIPISIKSEATVKTPLTIAEQADPLPPQQVLRGPSSTPQMSAPPLLSPLNTPAPSPQPIVSGVGTLPPIPFPRKSLTARPVKQDLFHQVHQERQLNKVEPQQKEAGDGKDDLLNTICLGAQHKAGLQLNHTSVADNDQGVENAEELVIDSYHIQDSGALPPTTRSASLSLSSQGRPQRGCASTIPISIKSEATVKTLLTIAEQADPLPPQQVLRGPSSTPQMSAPPLLSPLNTPAPSPQPRVSGAGTLPPIPFPRKSLTPRPVKQDLFDQVHQERQLNKVEPQQKEAGDGKDDLLNTICLGAKLKAGLQLNHTCVADNYQGVEVAEELVIGSYHIQDSGVDTEKAICTSFRTYID